VAIAKHGLQTLLSANYYFTDLLSSDGLLQKEPEQKLVWLCGGILSNIALHPNNRYPMSFPTLHYPVLRYPALFSLQAAMMSLCDTVGHGFKSQW